MSASKVGISYCLHDDYWFLNASLYPFRVAGPVTVFVSRTAWDGTDGCWERCAEVATKAGAEVVLGDWPDESQHRAFALAQMKERGYGAVSFGLAEASSC